MPAKAPSKPAVAEPKKAKAKADPVVHRAEKQGPLGPVERKTESQLIAEAAKAA